VAAGNGLGVFGTTLALLRKAFFPLAWGLARLSDLTGRLFGRGSADASQMVARQRFRHFFTSGHEMSEMSEYQATVAGNILELGQRRVKDAMIPIDRVGRIPLATPPAELHRRFVAMAFSRLGVFVEHPDRIIGYVSVYDVALADHLPPVSELLREAPRINGELPVPDAVERIRNAQGPWAIVVNNAGDHIGIVTMKDLVEEITGEIYEW
jgi:CBS domain containing-hemolysin-like protein